MNLLFLCTGNSCRSILAEATFNHLAPAGWHATSAGSQATGQVHAAFVQACRILRVRIEAFLALPLDALARDRAALKA